MSSVSDNDPHAVPRLPRPASGSFYPQPNSALFGRCIQGVAYEIGYDLTDFVSETCCYGSSLALRLYVDVLVREPASKECQDRINQVADVDLARGVGLFMEPQSLRCDL